MSLRFTVKGYRQNKNALDLRLKQLEL